MWNSSNRLNPGATYYRLRLDLTESSFVLAFNTHFVPQIIAGNSASRFRSAILEKNQVLNEVFDSH